MQKLKGPTSEQREKFNEEEWETDFFPLRPYRRPSKQKKEYKREEGESKPEVVPRNDAGIIQYGADNLLYYAFSVNKSYIFKYDALEMRTWKKEIVNLDQKRLPSGCQVI